VHHNKSPFWCNFVRIVTFSSWHYLMLLKWQFFYGLYSHFKEDSNILKYALIRYHTNKLWIFEVLNITFPKVWVGFSKSISSWDLQALYAYARLQYFSPLQAYILPTHGYGIVTITFQFPNCDLIQFLEKWLLFHRTNTSCSSCSG
jgi:hypothetical protein